ncbi:hypothetical protein [Lysinibacillus sp. NPDC047702]|uniref:hypothetical protein n=1 Tax=unclassified Lysinibacillus TaxID=2636778 RepID=UPI003CFD8479
MIDIRNKRLVTTRKEHKCFGCTETIEKGQKAVACKGEQDGKPMNLHLHEECNKVIAKDKCYSGSGLFYGCIKEAEKASQAMSGITLTPDEGLPFI